MWNTVIECISWELNENPVDSTNPTDYSREDIVTHRFSHIHTADQGIKQKLTMWCLLILERNVVMQSEAFRSKWTEEIMSFNTSESKLISSGKIISRRKVVCRLEALWGILVSFCRSTIDVLLVRSSLAIFWRCYDWRDIWWWKKHEIQWEKIAQRRNGCDTCR